MKRTTLALCLFIVLLAPVMPLSQSDLALANAESSLTKPSVPEFTVKFVYSSYNVTTTDPYTGVNATQQFDNNTIQVTIKNQPFGYSSNGVTYRLYYNVRTKPRFEGNWTERYPVIDRPNSPYDWDNKSWSYSKYLFDPNSQLQSNSDYTVISYALGENGFYLFIGLPSNAQLDFQVEAIVGHESQAWAIEHPLAPEYGGYYEPAIAFDYTSGWSNTQTITINGSAPTTTPTASPSQYPTATPDAHDDVDQQGFNWVEISLFAALGIIVAFLVVIALMRRRQTKK